MRTLRFALLMTVLLTVFAAVPLCAETIYIGDRLVVTIREIPEDAAPSIATLKSDDPVELLAEGDRYFHIRTADGTEGYIKKQYLTKDRPKTLLIAELKRQIAQQTRAMADLQEALSSREAAGKQSQGALSDTIDRLNKELAAGNRELDATRKELATLQQEHEALKKDAGDVVSLVNARANLQKENGRLTDELNALREENAYLLRTGVIKWFLAGAGVLLVGWMVGKSSRRKRRY